MMKALSLLERLLVLLTITIVISCDKLPEDINLESIPSYYFPYLDNRVKCINDAIDDCSGDFESFFWITDIHWEPDLNTRYSPHLIRYIALQTGVDKILNGGDTGNSQVICNNAISQLKKAIGSDKVYTVTGNHEINDASRYEDPFERLASTLRGHNNNLVYGDNNKTYFYFDSVTEKVRYIGLSSFGLFLNGSYDSFYKDEQLDWFKKEALNVQSGWTIIIFTHTLYSVDELDKLVTGHAGASYFIDAIESYNGNGAIACVLMGHAHRDRLHIGKTGIPYIISACDRHVTYHGDINVERIPGTISEQHFEVVVIDKAKRIINLFSIGANARDGHDDAPGKEVDVRIIHY